MIDIDPEKVTGMQASRGLRDSRASEAKYKLNNPLEVEKRRRLLENKSSIETAKASDGIKKAATPATPAQKSASQAAAMEAVSSVGSGENAAQGVGKAGLAAGMLASTSANPAMIAAAPWMAGAGLALGVVGNIKAKKLAAENANIAADNAFEQEQGRQRISAAKDMISIGRNLRLL